MNYVFPYTALPQSYTAQAPPWALTPLQLWRQATGLNWNHLWLGRQLPDLISGVGLNRLSGALDNVAVTGLKGGLTGVAFQVAAGTNDAWEVANVLVGDSTQPVLVAIVFRTTAGLPSATRNLLCDRDSVSPNPGYEVNLETNGSLTAFGDPGVGTSRIVSVAGNHADNAWHVVVLRETTTAGLATTEMASDVGNASNSASTQGSSPSIPLTLGRRRLQAGAIQYAAFAVALGAEVTSANIITMPGRVKSTFVS